MFSHIVSSRRHFIVLIVGVIIGFGCTYFIENLYQVGDEELTTQYTQFIPKSPHSHGETDNFAAPDQEQSWSDQENHHHHGKCQTHCDRKVLHFCYELVNYFTRVHYECDIFFICNTFIDTYLKI